MTQPTVYMLIGVPCSGKSTFIKSLTKDFAYISSDYFVDKFAAKMGKTYNEVFSEVVPRATRLMNRRLHKAREAGRDIVWDQTNTSAKSRAKKLAQLPEYCKVAFFFETPPKHILDERLSNRPGKGIPFHVLNQMMLNLEPPTLDEGFVQITKLNTFEGD